MQFLKSLSGPARSPYVVHVPSKSHEQPDQANQRAQKQNLWQNHQSVELRHIPMNQNFPVRPVHNRAIRRQHWMWPRIVIGDRDRAAKERQNREDD